MKPLLIIACCLAFLSVGAVVAKNMVASSSTEGAEVMKAGPQQKATFAGGCFWCMEKPFEELDGVISVISGYAGGTTTNPTYKNYMSGGHIEVIEITYNPEKVSYQDLLDVYWRQVDPTDPGGQFVDRGHGYSTAIFYHDDEQRLQALDSRDKLAASTIFDKPIVTPILPAAPFYRAEEYHQDYYKKSSFKYKYYRARSGRDVFLDKVWGKQQAKTADDGDLKKRLTPLQYQVTRQNGTEPPYNNEYWNNKDPGIYVDIVSNEPLFSSLDKYDSGTGWPSFTRPLVNDNVIEKEDRQFFMVRTEVRSKHGDSHLGHLFHDGPAPTGLRYCINSASLRFIHADTLGSEGFEEFANLFTQ